MVFKYKRSIKIYYYKENSENSHTLLGQRSIIRSFSLFAGGHGTWPPRKAKDLKWHRIQKLLN